MRIIIIIIMIIFIIIIMIDVIVIIFIYYWHYACYWYYFIDIIWFLFPGEWEGQRLVRRGKAAQAVGLAQESATQARVNANARR